MRKFIIVVLYIILNSYNANAIGVQSQLNAEGDWDTVLISSSPATDVIVTSTSAFTQLAVQNLTVSTNIWCSDDRTVAENNRGVRIGPGQLMGFTLYPGQIYYCKNDGGTGPISASIFRGR